VKIHIVIHSFMEIRISISSHWIPIAWFFTVQISWLHLHCVLVLWMNWCLLITRILESVFFNYVACNNMKKLNWR